MSEPTIAELNAQLLAAIEVVLQLARLNGETRPPYPNQAPSLERLELIDLRLREARHHAKRL